MTMMNALCLHHHHRGTSLPFRATAAPILKTRKGCHRNPPRASFGDDDEEQGDENKTPLSSLTSAIELRSKLQEVALVAQTRY